MIYLRILLPILLFLLLQVYSLALKQDLILSRPLEDVVPVPYQIYSRLHTYAHLLDIAYCIDGLRRIEEPFGCELDCSALFPHLQLVHQWYFEDSSCGYIASTNETLFGANSTENNGKYTIVVSIRGTRSVSDTMTDLNFDMTPFAVPGNAIPACGAQCKVHAGFHGYYKDAMAMVQPYVMSELKKGGPDAQVLIVGHSMGGSVGLLMALHFLSIGVENIYLVTMGQPLVGNREFAEWADFALGSRYQLDLGPKNRKWLRVVHRNDIVTTIPRGSFLRRYEQFNNQIYLNVSAANAQPRAEQVVDCLLGDNRQCIAGDVLLPRLLSDYLLSHNTYFRHLGLCGIHSDKQDDQEARSF